MREDRIMPGVSRLLRRLEPSLGRREPSIREAQEIIERHGLEDLTLVELSRLGHQTPEPMKAKLKHLS